MPTYVYEFQDGKRERIEVFQHMKDDPIAEIDGRPVQRIICPPQLAGVDKWVKYPYVSNSLPTTIQGCKMVRQKKAGQWTRRKPLIESQRHEREVAARNDLMKMDD